MHIFEISSRSIPNNPKKMRITLNSKLKNKNVTIRPEKSNERLEIIKRQTLN